MNSYKKIQYIMALCSIQFEDSIEAYQDRVNSHLTSGSISVDELQAEPKDVLTNPKLSWLEMAKSSEFFAYDQNIDESDIIENFKSVLPNTYQSSFD